MKQLSLLFDDPPNEEQPPSTETGESATPAANCEAHPATAIEEICGHIRYKVQRIRPPVKAHGGKYYLARQIVPVLLSAPGNPTEYLEPCAFGASLFLAMPRFEREILGDINPGVVQLWRTLTHERLSTLRSDRRAVHGRCVRGGKESRTNRPSRGHRSIPDP